ncbi:MAG: glycerate kinase [Sediminicola sp.]
MNFLLIPDKFKNSISAKEVSAAISRGLVKVWSQCNITAIAASDGGDGFLEAIQKSQNLEERSVETVDPLGRRIISPYLFDGATNTAYLELANTSGVQLLKESELDIMNTSTLGTGIMIGKAIERGARTIYLGIGGSATNDGGMGIAHALGYRFLDQMGNMLLPVGKNLPKICGIESTQLSVELDHVAFFAVNDVSNPLYGPHGAAHVYAEQKGAKNDDMDILDMGLENLAKIVKKDIGIDMAKSPGSGAAGGAAYGLGVFCRAKFIKGTDFIFEIADVASILESNKIDYIVTGEGKLDNQTFEGKLIKGVMELGRRYQIPVIAICGKLEVGTELPRKYGILDVLEIHHSGQSLQYSMENAAILIEKEIYTYFLELPKTDKHHKI